MASHRLQSFLALEIQKAAGRPKIDRGLRDLIQRMSKENSQWGASRIHGELLMLGFTVAQSTVSKYMVRPSKPPSQSWKTFLRNHAQAIAAIDLYAFRIAILPRRSRRDRPVADTHGPHPGREDLPVGTVIVPHQIGRR